MSSKQKFCGWKALNKRDGTVESNFSAKEVTEEIKGGDGKK